MNKDHKDSLLILCLNVSFWTVEPVGLARIDVRFPWVGCHSEIWIE